jgi:hypothetical protein
MAQWEGTCPASVKTLISNPILPHPQKNVAGKKNFL